MKNSQLTLLKVAYWCFEGDLYLAEPEERLGLHMLDMEIELSFADERSQFVSWYRDYEVGVQEKSFFNCTGIRLDVSNHLPWSPLIGGLVTIDREWRDKQVLEIRGQAGSMYITSRESGKWYRDTLTISAEPPDWPRLGF